MNSQQNQPPGVARHLASIFVLPFMALVVIPTTIRFFGAAYDTSWPAAGHTVSMASASVVGAIGFALFASSIWLFATVGRGTLAPWDPTERLVVRGPYRYVRNPMLSGVLLMLAATSIAFGSALLAGWTLFFFALNTVYFIRSEEPGLRRRFGDSYEVYCRNVPRWLPRWAPWNGG